MTQTDIIAGHWRNHIGHLVPEDQIKPIDLARDQLVRELVDKARATSEVLAKFKGEAFGDIAAFVDLSLGEYGVHVGDKKGNVTLVSYDGRYKVLRAIQENVTFDERLKAAKSLIDECLKEWSEGAAAELQTIVQDAFRVDVQGNNPATRNRTRCGPAI